jgi:PhnB protein
MAIKSLNPYINFNGTAMQAIALYERVLGATTLNVARAGDVPGMNVPADQRERVMHGVLRVGASQLMVSDAPPAQPVSMAGNVHVSLDFEDIDEMARKFTSLADGRAVTVPLRDTFWGATFGMLTDRFGVRWMFNCAASTRGDVIGGRAPYSQE